MNEMQLLTWARGAGLDIAISVFLFAGLLRLVEIYSLGRKRDVSPPRHRAGATGMHTLLRRSLPPPGMMERSPVNYLGGYVFHIGLFVIVFGFAPHIKLIEELTGLSWPALPSQLVDLTTAVTLAAMLVVLYDRIKKPVKRYLSTFGDWFAWTVTFLPVATGYLAVQHLLLPYPTMLALHILSAELLLIFIPFTKLFHAVVLFPSRWYNGSINGHRGVAT